MSADATILDARRPLTVKITCYFCGKMLPLGLPPAHDCAGIGRARRRGNARLQIQWDWGDFVEESV